MRKFVAKFLTMSKRAAKRQVENKVVAAIDVIIERYATEEKMADTKTDLLIDIFDKAVAGINAEKKIVGRSEKKKYFKALFTNVDQQVEIVVNGK